MIGTGIGFLDELFGFYQADRIGLIEYSRAVAQTRANQMEISKGKYYVARSGRIFGPIDDEPKALIAGSVWVWRLLDPGEGWFHWTLSGKWFQDPTKESPNDLIREATLAEQTRERLKTDEAAGWVDRAKEAEEEYPDHMGNAYVKVEKASPRSGMTKHHLLDLAKEATADRGLNYGKPEDNFARIAAHWTAYIRNTGLLTAREVETFEFTGTDVAIMCALLKIARLEHQPSHQDSWIDLAGYAACGAEIALARTGTMDEADRAGRDGDYLGKGKP